MKYKTFRCVILLRMWVGIVQSVQRLVLVRGSNAGGGKIFPSRPDRP